MISMKDISLQKIEEMNNIKAALRRLGRNALTTFIVTFAVFVSNSDLKECIQTGIKLGFGGFIKSLWVVSFYPALLAGLVGTITAVSKYIRDKWDIKLPF
mgnify:CR=1 FL=1